ncbi:conserved hypothetical protein [Pediculus humanus corporis]|uniref:Uncharacterized protein n=1 Tax=Pediculus humanus subsp. corporis TaxID=121224 RepID=E0VCG9_PEDHC|nr:uncharacterized protein Phum_PHUM087070 [Pediculus humanus corporis]EEB11075.1 conserved hypothetical protein [Pediculus humanus corporis]
MSSRIIRETGYFGPWQVCKKLPYNREKCGTEANTFEPIAAVYFAGIAAAFGVTFLGLFCILSVVQMAMVTQKDKVMIKYSRCVAIKLVLAILSTILAIVSAGLFALQTDDRKNNFRITRGESFYLQILLIILNFILFVASLYDFLFSRRLGGDPTMATRDPGGEAATTYNNPHFREDSNKNHAGIQGIREKEEEKMKTIKKYIMKFFFLKGISMTDASGKPYARSPTYNGSLASVTTMTTTTSNGSSVTRSPLRSSLKKPRPPPGDSSLGIHNPGFSQGSPTMQRNGSVKKVRIQTHSTAV